MNFDQPFFKRNFIGQEYIVHDTSSNSPYIDFPDMPTYIGGGVSIVKFYPSTVNLHTLAPLEAEVLDANGNAIRTEVSDFRDRFGNYYLSIYVDDFTAEGYGSISFVGVANATPDGEYLEPDQVNKQGYNLIITKPLLIQPFERNSSPLIFDQPPVVSVGMIIAPVRLAVSQEGKPIVTKLVSRFTASFTTANVEGFDKVAATSVQIQDPKFREFAVKNVAASTTVNQVPITVRQNDYDLEGGQLINDTNRYKTIFTLTGAGATEGQAGSSFNQFTSNLKGAQVTLNKYNTYRNVTRSLSPTAVFSDTNPYNDLQNPGQTQSLNTQLNQYVGTIVRVLTTSSALIDLPLKVNIDSYSNLRKNPITRKTTHTFRQANNVRVRAEYYNPDLLVASNNISQSYLQFTFQSLQPIGGSVYRIKTYYRQTGFQQHDYALLGDQRVGTTEYLTDANSLNRLFYGKEITPFLMTGHFDNQNIITSYWKGYSETKTTIDTLDILRNDTVLIDSAKVPVSNGLATSVLTTANYQIYQQGQTFSFSFICTLDPNTTLEVYANSKLISTQLYNPSPFAQAFETSKNNEKSRYSGNESRFGKYIGKITNNTGERKDYGRVIFDVMADYEGYGRPLFRVKSTNQTGSATAYISEISVTPLQKNGYTPEIYQYNINAPEGFQQIVSESVDFKFEYFDYTGNQSEYVTYLNGINLALQTEIQSSVCQIEKYKFVFNPTVWSIVTESATFRQPFVAPYGLSTGSLTTNAIIGTGSTSNAENLNGFNSHSFAQVGLAATAPFISPNSLPSTPQEDYFLRGWGRDAIVYSVNPNAIGLNLALSGSTVQSANGAVAGRSQQRRYFPAYDHMRALTSFHDAYGRGLQTPDQDNFLQGYTNRTYGYGVGSTYRGPVTSQHFWSGWNALRPWKPIYANRWLNKTTVADLNNGLYNGKFYYTASWEIFPALGQGVYYRATTNGTSLRATSFNPAAGLPGVVRNTPIVGARVTASWKFFDQFSENYNQTAGDAMYLDYTPAYALITASYNQAVISASYKPVGASLSSPSILGSSSIDLSYPVNSGAAGITRFDVSQSYVTTSGAGFTTSQKAAAYKQRRFYFPQGGPLTSSVFTENGGIYNVKFKLKRYQSGSNSQNWFSPDTGSYLMVYIFDVSTQFTTASEGFPGYYPPPQNIVKIGNQVTTNGYNIPPIQFYDSVTGFLYDEYEINLIQYGTPGQLVFEPSGDNGSYFGCAVDSVEFCKIGTTTDPYYIKPPADDLF